MARLHGQAAGNIPGADVGVTTCVIHPGTRRMKEQRERNFGIRVAVYEFRKLVPQRAFVSLQLGRLDDNINPTP
jgi:hypothetical protein